MTDKETKQLKKTLLTLVPVNGSAIGNVNLQAKFKKATALKIEPSTYWEIRNELIRDGELVKGRGKGGSVYRPDNAITRKTNSPYKKESDLYDPFLKTLQNDWVRDSGITTSIIEKTAHQGRKSTGGKWTRPDISVVAIESYQYLPGKFLDITSFEIKPLGGFDVSGVFEAASHRAFAHYTYLAIHIDSDEDKKRIEFERLENECARLGVGLMVFANPAEYETWEFHVEPIRSEPDPKNMDEFIDIQFSQENKKELIRLKS